MLRYFSTFFQEKTTLQPLSTGHQSSHVYLENAEAANAFIYSLEIEEYDLHPDLKH